MDPVTIGLGAIGLGRSLFGSGDPFKTYHPQPFKFSPNENDPELALRRRRSLRDSQIRRMRTLDEISRSGLGGSSAAFGILDNEQNNEYRSLEDIDSDAFAKQRQEELQLYRDQAEYERQLSLARGRHRSASQFSALDSLGDIGGYIGGELVPDLPEVNRFLYDDPSMTAPRYSQAGPRRREMYP